ncbi:MAG: CbiX/SirB N-terminal domain-containing protein [Hydrogenophilaceae bacterium]|nr:CbiX/SirB N-terminal domain-containing protein [Hydrogenophilaceae bacterium]
MNTRMLLIIAHGSRRQTSNDEVRELGERIRRLNTPAIDEVRVAFLELAKPDIPEGLAQCVADGANEIVVFPYFLAAGTHVATDIPEEIDAFCASHPQIKVTLTPHLGASATLPQAILEVVMADENALA